MNEEENTLPRLRIVQHVGGLVSQGLVPGKGYIVPQESWGTRYPICGVGDKLRLIVKGMNVCYGEAFPPETNRMMRPCLELTLLLPDLGVTVQADLFGESYHNAGVRTVRSLMKFGNWPATIVTWDLRKWDPSFAHPIYFWNWVDATLGEPMLDVSLMI
jgi:hypothetical protein